MTMRANTGNAPILRLAQLSIIAVAATWGATAEPALADLVITDPGGATIVQNGNTWTITAPDGTIISYDQFDVALNQIVQFVQPGDLARVLNRVDSVNPSLIQGSLLSNGIIYIVNPAGIMFGGGATVDVGGLYAAAGDISDADFLSGVDHFTNLGGEVFVHNNAEVRGHVVHLFGQRVINEGLIESDGGIITMIAGNEVLLTEVGGRLIIHVDGSQLTDLDEPQAGTHAPSMITSAAVKNTGTIRNHGGRIVLGAGDMASLAFKNKGTIEAAGGEINLVAAGGLIHNDGTIDVSADGDAGIITAQGPAILNTCIFKADSENGAAGSISLRSHSHTLLSDASIVTAEGVSGGDLVLESTNGLTAIAEDAQTSVRGTQDGGTALIKGDSVILNGVVSTAGAEGFASGLLHVDGPKDIFVVQDGLNDSFMSGIIDFASVPMNGNGYVQTSAITQGNRSVRLHATRDVEVADMLDFDLTTDLVLSAGNNIRLDAALLGVNDLFLDADADASGAGFNAVDTAIDISGNAVFGGTDTFLRGGDIVTGGTQDYLGATWIGVDLSLDATGIVFHKKLQSKSLTMILPRLTINAATTTFNGPVGNELQLRSLVVNGDSFMNGGIVSTEEYQRYNGLLQLGADTQLLSTAGGEIFMNQVDGPFDLSVDTAGLTTVNGTIGGNQKLTGFFTDAAGSTLLNADVNANSIDFGDAVTLGTNVVINGSDDAAFRMGVDGGGFDLTVNSDLTTFEGDVLDIDELVTDAAGRTIIAANRISGRTIAFHDIVELQSDSLVTGLETVEFGQTIDGGFELGVVGGSQLLFGGDIGGQTMLKSLTLEAGANINDKNVIIFDGNLVRAQCDIRLNAAGRSTPSLVASIAGRGGDLQLISTDGAVVVGRNEKVTALGNLSISGNMVTFGDLNALGNITVDSPLIRMWRRGAGMLLDANGNMVRDLGADVVATGAISFTSGPSLLGSGRGPIFAAGKGISPSLGNFNQLSSAGIGANDFTFSGIVLDLRPGSIANLAEALEEIDGTIEDRVPRDPFALQALDRLAINLRGLSPSELVGLLDGTALYRDMPNTGLQMGPVATSVARLRHDSVIDLVNRYASIFTETLLDSETGMLLIDSETGLPMQRDRTEDIRAALEEAWNEYQNTPDTDGFRAWLQTRPDQAGVLAYVNGLGEMLREVWTMGCSRREFRASCDGVLGPITPRAMSQRDLEEAIGVNMLISHMGGGVPAG